MSALVGHAEHRSYIADSETILGELARHLPAFLSSDVDVGPGLLNHPFCFFEFGRQFGIQDGTDVDLDLIGWQAGDKRNGLTVFVGGRPPV